MEEALKSNVKHKHGCIIYDHNGVVVTGYNTRHNGKSIHAEVMAIDRLKKKYNGKLKRLHYKAHLCILVIRINKKGELRNSFPCDNCYRKIVNFYIKYSLFSHINFSVYDGIKTISIW